MVGGSSNKVGFVRMGEHDLALPSRGSAYSAGLDLRTTCDFTLSSLCDLMTVSVATGFAVELPKGCYGRIAPRSGLAKMGVNVLGGVIDQDYRGELVVLLQLTDERSILNFQTGDRIAQLIITPYGDHTPIEVNYLSNSERGEGGFMSTGLS